MRASIGLFLLVVVLCFSCNERKIARIHSENEALRRELTAARAVADAFRDVDAALDSVEMCIGLSSTLRINAGYGEFSTRLQRIQAYVRNSRNAIDDAARDAHASRRQAEAYRMLAEALKSELGLRIQDATEMELTIANYMEENTMLNSNLSVRLETMVDLKKRLEEKEEELRLLQTRLSDGELVVKRH